jgi:plastocyanin
MSIFKIQIKAGNPATFDPNPLTCFVNDSVFWFNGDPKQSHWPAPSVANKTQWLDFQITPNTPSNQITFSKVKTYKYVCANHPNETGTIIVKPAKKTSFGGKTKKGAFGYKTYKPKKKGAFGRITSR